MTFIACTREHFEKVILPRSKKESEDPKLYFGMIEPEKRSYQIVTGKDGIKEAIIPITGDLGNSRWWGTRYADIKESVNDAEQDYQVQRIVFDINSPGGYIDGVSETAEAISNCKKETVARVGHMAASAAYWLACACDKIEATTKVALFGSIGVIVSYYDWSKYLEEAGIKEVIVTSTDAPKKHLDPATDQGRSELLGRLDKTHAIFAEFVANGRNTTIEKVNSDFGQGGLLIAEDALKAGMIDGITVGNISTNSEEFDMTKTYTQEEYDSGLKAATENLLKHTKFIGRAKSETVIANMEAGKPFADCVEGYCNEELASRLLAEKKESNPPEAIVTGDAALKNEEEAKEKASAKKTVDILNSWEV